MATSITSKPKELLLKKDVHTEGSNLQTNLKISNSLITDTIFKKLGDNRIKNIELVNCTMTKKVAENLVTSGTKENVIFKKCNLSDKNNLIIDNVGLCKCPLPKEFLTELDAPDEIVPLEEARPDVTKEKLEEEIAYAKALKDFAHKSILPEITPVLEDSVSSEGQPIVVDTISRHDLKGLRERIFTCIAEVDRIIEGYNKHTDHNNLLFDQITRENQNFTDVLYNGTARGKHVSLNSRRLVFDGTDLGPSVCISNAIATTYRWGREP